MVATLKSRKQRITDIVFGLTPMTSFLLWVLLSLLFTGTFKSGKGEISGFFYMIGIAVIIFGIFFIFVRPKIKD